MSKLTKNETKLYRKYHLPGCGNLNSVKLNAIFLRKGNTIEHERMKFELAWEALQNDQNFLVEAERGSKGQRKIVDFVNLTEETEYEICCSNEGHKEIKKYRDEGILPIIVGRSFTCMLCGLKYNKPSRDGVCKNCK